MTTICYNRLHENFCANFNLNYKTHTRKKYFFLGLTVLLLSFSFTAKAQTLQPLHDAYLENKVAPFDPVDNRFFNNEVLRVEKSPTRIRETYLMFDLTSITGTITDAQLELTVYTDPGTGTINTYKGSSDGWTDTNISNANKPDKGNLLGSITGTHSEGSVKIVNIAPNMLSGNFLTLVLEHTTSSDVGFASTGPDNSTFDLAPETIWPRLVITANSTPADTMAPTVPAGVTASNITATSADLNWSPSTDNGGGNVAGYYIYNNGVQIATSTGTSTQLTGLTESTSYQISIGAFDNATPPNVSAISSPSVDFTTLSSGGGTTGGHWTKTGSDISYSLGNVGIGTNALSTHKLAVDGKIRSREVRVDNESWADYVFYNDYKLPTLQEVEQHIQEKGHLINIPSAKEVEANGIELGEMDKLLLEKIEELTLYILEQERRLQKLEDSKNEKKNR